MAEVELDKENEESLIALTTHFAQVQFRLKQIISAEPQHKEALLHDLEDFAFQGCKPMTYDTAASGENTSTEAQRKMRTTLMEKLQHQLTEIERTAQEVTNEEEGSGGEQSSSMAEKQKIIIEELRKRFDLQFGNLDEMSPEELKHNVEKAVNDVVDPIKSKDRYVSQLQSQIVDLERYIGFLQEANPNRQLSPASNQSSGLPLPRSHDTNTLLHIPRHKSNPRKRQKSISHESTSVSHDLPVKPIHTLSIPSEQGGRSHDPITASGDLVPVHEKSDSEEASTPTTPDDVIGPFLRHGSKPVPDYQLLLTQLDREQSVGSNHKEWTTSRSSLKEPLAGESKGADDLRLSLLVMRKTLAVMQVVTLCQCGGTFHCLPRAMPLGGAKGYQGALHSLEECVDRIAVITAALSEQGIPLESRVTLETDLHDAVTMTMADNLRVLVEHGLLDGGKPLTMPPGCFPLWRAGSRSKKKLGEDCFAWKVFKHYYTIKRGPQFSGKTDQLLASSFAIPLSSQGSMKKTLLAAVHRTDTAYQGCHHRSRDTKFRALICEGFNVGHLAEWFRIIAGHPSVTEDLYSVTSFMATTGFRPALGCLERLKDNPTGHTVNLPRDYYKCPEAYQPKAL